ncbi:glycerol-3-phosphate 1-O-acyltransferase PlsY [Gloeocapsa sp. PCC 73106]|uniref:glycerol-3-phosphate 1-O-acyltransferase PlsY n=1 Tax=Gloeocapsa sp. PCC 73106 TaxID=102232 RepID=UPI0002ABFB8D|nr:glycerol-3-phosphate 1-O-acyltransferase PlsY [Gloeocapsa sp. PCC 73106]ELR97533.1 acyl-phosphate glycerol 3-phosphate acyltransferase [Gloeocapsa sp. PCC 73106]
MFTSGLITLGLLLLAYLLGSIPTGYWVAKYLKDIDIREYGSGSTGATNVLRNVGKGAALTVLIVDLLKGAIAIALTIFVVRSTLPLAWESWLVILTGLAAIVGHSKSIWLNFSGGKSVATSLGVLFLINPVVALVSLGVFLVVLGISRIVSLSSISAAIAVAISMFLLHQPLPFLCFGILVSTYVIWRHQSNLQRLFAGTEPRLGDSIPVD